MLGDQASQRQHTTTHNSTNTHVGPGFPLPSTLGPKGAAGGGAQNEHNDRCHVRCLSAPELSHCIAMHECCSSSSHVRGKAALQVTASHSSLAAATEKALFAINWHGQHNAGSHWTFSHLFRSLAQTPFLFGLLCARWLLIEGPLTTLNAC